MQALRTRVRARAGELTQHLVARYFPERQLFLRSRGQVRFVSLSPRAQLVCAGGLALVLGWVVFASGGLMLKNHVIAAKNQRLAEMEQAYGALSDDMSRVQRYFVATTREIEAKHRTLAAAVGQKNEIENRLAGVADRLGPDAGKAGGKTAVAAVTGVEAPSPVPPAGATAGRLEGLEGRLAGVSGAQRVLIARLQQKTRDGVAKLESMIGVTGLDLERLLDGPGPESLSVGGPLIRLSQSQAAMLAEEDFETRLMELAAQLSRLSGLENALQSLPLIAPSDHYYVSSRYGRRRDPVTKQWSMHSGIDLSGIAKTPILATAPGKVVYAGRNGPYGNMVEIDHGQGLRTRYGHMHRIYVKVGEQVEFRQELGQMGSTGRATGPHVHYEIWFDGKPRNPGQFLKAGRHVLGKG